MVKAGMYFGLIVLVAGLLIAFGLMKNNAVVIGLGFILLAACAIFGMQPTFAGPRETERRR